MKSIFCGVYHSLLIITFSIHFIIHERCEANEWTVDPGGGGDWTSITSAIEYAQDGDTIRVKSGIYYENIDFAGKTIYLIGENGAESTIIHGVSMRPVVTFSGGESAGTLLRGFTITGGDITDGDDHSFNMGGGIYGYDTEVEIWECIIEDNYVGGDGFSGAGGGISFISSSPIISNSIIRDNRSIRSSEEDALPSMGGGIYLEDCVASISESQFTDNIVAGEEGRGGGLFALYTEIWLDGCIFEKNLASRGGAIFIYNVNGTISNNQILNNYASSEAGGIYSMNSITQDYDPTGESLYLIIRNTIISGNSGGGLLLKNGDAPFEDSIYIIRNNSIVENGGDGIACSFSSGRQIYIFLMNNIVAYNGGIGIKSNEFDIRMTYLSYSDIYANRMGDLSDSISKFEGRDGNISESPLFSSFYNDLLFVSEDYHLKEGSPCIDSGNPDEVYNDDDGTRNDMGAFGGPSTDEEPDIVLPEGEEEEETVVDEVGCRCLYGGSGFEPASSILVTTFLPLLFFRRRVYDMRVNNNCRIKSREV